MSALACRDCGYMLELSEMSAPRSERRSRKYDRSIYLAAVVPGVILLAILAAGAWVYFIR